MTKDRMMLSRFYAQYSQKVEAIRSRLERPLTLAEKILYTHLYNGMPEAALKRGEDYANFRPDRVAMQDATAQMALLQLMNAGRQHVAVPASVHCDHLIKASDGRGRDLPQALTDNREVYHFLESVSSRYGIDFWKPGAGIIHQSVLENYAFPGGMMVGTDSHTPNAGGLGMVAVGVGGADAVDVLSGMEWELRVPRIIGVRLTGQLSEWASPKDVILHLTGLLTVKGGTNAIIEYFGEGTKSISATGKATICNMGAETGATTSLFPYDDATARYLRATDRSDVAGMADQVATELRADPEVTAQPERYYDRVIDINLPELSTSINGPFTPDAAHTATDIATFLKENDYPKKVDVALIGSCTNSSYEDLAKAHALARQCMEKRLEIKAQLIICPGSEKILQTARRDGIIDTFEQLGAVVMTNACGPCIGQWQRKTDEPTRKNTIVTTFNRNFAKRADGNPNTCAFIVSPVMAIAYAFSGDLTFNPLTDRLLTADGKEVMLEAPESLELPQTGFAACDEGCIAPDNQKRDICIPADSERLQALKPFAPCNEKDFERMTLLIKTKGKCTTDHISMAGPWLRFRGHLEHISDNLLMGAVNAFNGKTNCVWNRLDGHYAAVSQVAKTYKQQGISSIIVAEENYGEGSSREHAAMEPRFLNVKVVLAKSFARIHETNLKKQGMLALTFANKDDYDRIEEQDQISIRGLDAIAPEQELQVCVHHADGREDRFAARHTYNKQQIGWFKAGSALNEIKRHE